MMLKKYLDKLPNWLKNKYVLVSCVFFTYLFFFSKYNLAYQYKLNKEQRKLYNVNAELSKKIVELKRIDDNLKQNPLTIEKIAREKYGMKRADETVFFIP
jgi:cell division protein DivIC